VFHVICLNNHLVYSSITPPLHQKNPFSPGGTAVLLSLSRGSKHLITSRDALSAVMLRIRVSFARGDLAERVWGIASLRNMAPVPGTPSMEEISSGF